MLRVFYQIIRSLQKYSHKANTLQRHIQHVFGLILLLLHAMSYVSNLYVYGQLLALLRVKSRTSTRYARRTIAKRIAAVFGFQELTIARTWNELVNCGLLPSNAKVKHLLYFLAYIKTYSALDVYSTMFDVSQKSFSEWVWQFARAIASMNHIVS